MQNQVALVSDDTDFFEYILPKLTLRKSDEVYKLNFDNILETIENLQSVIFIINSEKNIEKTLQLLEIVKSSPSIVFGYNENEAYRNKCLKAGCLEYFSYFTADEEFDIIIQSALSFLSLINQNKFYRELLIEHKAISANNNVFLDYKTIIDKELKIIDRKSVSSVLVAISPNEKIKFLLQPNQIETFILNNIRKDDILMNFAPNKYFLLLNNTKMDEAKKIWEKIKAQLPEEIFAGFALAGRKTRSQLINEALNKLHENINKAQLYGKTITSENEINTNFKLFRQEFYKKIEQVLNPVFYHIQQKYGDKYYGIAMNHEIGEGFGNFYIKSRNIEAEMKITTPGCTKINIDILYNLLSKNSLKIPESKRITLEPREFEAELLESLIEQFISEFKGEVINE